MIWQAPSSDGGSPVTGYKVHRATASGGPYTQVASLGNVPSFKDTGLGNGATRYYVVTAANVAGPSAASDEANATTFRLPGPPKNLAGQATTGVSLQGTTLGLGIKLTWQAPSDTGGTSLTGYKVYWSTNPNAANPQQVCSVGGEVLTCNHNGADPLKPNYYWVAAENPAGQGPKSARACAVTYPWALVPLSPPGGPCQP